MQLLDLDSHSRLRNGQWGTGCPPRCRVAGPCGGEACGGRPGTEGNDEAGQRSGKDGLEECGMLLDRARAAPMRAVGCWVWLGGPVLAGRGAVDSGLALAGGRDLGARLAVWPAGPMAWPERVSSNTSITSPRRPRPPSSPPPACRAQQDRNQAQLAEWSALDSSKLESGWPRQRGCRSPAGPASRA